MKKTIRHKNRSAEIKVELNKIVERGLNGKTYHSVSIVSFHKEPYRKERKVHSKENLEEIIKEMVNDFIENTDNQNLSKEEQLLYKLGFTNY